MPSVRTICSLSDSQIIVVPLDPVSGNTRSPVTESGESPARNPICSSRLASSKSAASLPMRDRLHEGGCIMALRPIFQTKTQVEHAAGDHDETDPERRATPRIRKKKYNPAMTSRTALTANPTLYGDTMTSLHHSTNFDKSSIAYHCIPNRPNKERPGIR